MYFHVKYLKDDYLILSHLPWVCAPCPLVFLEPSTFKILCRNQFVDKGKGLQTKHLENHSVLNVKFDILFLEGEWKSWRNPWPPPGPPANPFLPPQPLCSHVPS